MLFPTFARISDDLERFQSSLLRSLRLLTLIVFPISFLFLAVGEPLAVVVFGESWRDAGPIMMALSGVGAGGALRSTASEASKARGRPEILPRLDGLAAVAPLLFMVVLLPAGSGRRGTCAVDRRARPGGVARCESLLRSRCFPLSAVLRQLRPAVLGSVVMTVPVLMLERFVVNADQAGRDLPVSSLWAPRSSWPRGLLPRGRAFRSPLASRATGRGQAAPQSQSLRGTLRRPSNRRRRRAVRNLEGLTLKALEHAWQRMSTVEGRGKDRNV